MALASAVARLMPRWKPWAAEDGHGHEVRVSIDEALHEVREGDDFVPVRKVLHTLDQAERLRGFFFFAIMFTTAYALGAHRLDVEEGRRSVTMLEAAASRAFDADLSEATLAFCAEADTRCRAPFPDAGTVDDLAAYLRAGLAPEINAINKVCPRCQVAVSTSGRTLQGQGKNDVVCSDFLVDDNANVSARSIFLIAMLEPRDCAAVDAAWRVDPWVGTPPCCRDRDLLRASLALHTAFTIDGTTTAPLEELLDHAQGGALRTYVQKRLAGDGHLVQLFVNRAGHAIGRLYAAEYRDREWAPELVVPKVRIWAYFFDATGTDTALSVLSIVFWCLSLGHELYAGWVRNYGARWRDALMSPFLWIVEVPSFLLPWVPPLIAPRMGVPAVAVAYAVVDLVLLARLFSEGAVFPAFRTLVRTLSSAVPQLLTFGVALFTTLVVFSGTSAKVLGPVSPAHASIGAAMNTLFGALVAGRELDEDAFAVAPEATTILFYVINVFVFLILAQFFIAILVGAFDKARTAEEEDRRDRGLPPGFEHKGDTWTLWGRAQAAAVYLASMRAFGVHAIVVHRGVLRAVDDVDKVRSARAKVEGRTFEQGGPVLLSVRELEVYVGPVAVRNILQSYCAKLGRPPAEVAEHLSPEAAAFALGESDGSGKPGKGDPSLDAPAHRGPTNGNSSKTFATSSY